jgi:hypothetical protein
MNFIPILAFHLTLTNNVAATKITRRNTRSILGNLSQQGKKTQPKSLAIFFKRKTFTTIKT